jgi:hypothetical protein
LHCLAPALTVYTFSETKPYRQEAVLSIRKQCWDHGGVCCVVGGRPAELGMGKCIDLYEIVVDYILGALIES